MTILGYLLLPVGIGCLVFSEKWLLRLFVFWTLFSATSAINFGETDTASGLQVWMLFGSFWLLRQIIRLIGNLSIFIDSRILSPCLWLVGIVMVASVSLVMPAYINGRLIISSAGLSQQAETPLYLTSHNFTQLLYLVFGVMLAIGIAHLSLRAEKREEIEKALLISAIVLSLWGGVEFICSVIGITYPSYIFNNSTSISALGYQETLSSGIARVSSATLEPSVFAQCLISALPLTLPAWFGVKPVLSRVWDRLASLLFVVMLILSTSTTAIFGIAVLAVLLLAVLKKSKLISFGRTVKLGAAGLAFAVAIATLLASSSTARQTLTDILLGKTGGGSAIERSMTVALAFGYFQQFPILGIGWGSATSHDLFVYLLSNVGVIGAAVFTVGMFVVIARSWKNLSPRHGRVDSRSMVWFLSLSSFLIVSIFVGFPLVLGNFWIALGMAIGAGQQGRPAESLVGARDHQVQYN